MPEVVQSTGADQSREGAGNAVAQHHIECSGV